MCVCRVNELVQLASSTLTGGRVTSSLSNCERAHVNAGNKSTNNASTELNGVASCPLDDVDTAVTRGCMSQPTAADNSAAVATVTSTQIHALQTCVDVLPSAEVGCIHNEALTTCCTTEQLCASSQTHLAVRTSDGLTMCPSETQTSELSSVKPPTVLTSSSDSASHVETFSSSVELCATSAMNISVTPPTLLTSSGDSASHVETFSSSVELYASSAMNTVCVADVASQASVTVSGVPVVTASAQSSGGVTPIQSSALQTSSTPDTLTWTTSEQLLSNTASSSSPALDKQIVSTDKLNSYRETNKSSAPTSSVSLNSAVKTVSATCTVSSLTSLLVHDKSRSSEHADRAKVASSSKKRPREVSTKNSTEVSGSVETEEKQTKRAKLDEASAIATQSPVVHNGILSAVTETGLTDEQRVSCYKTIGARGERMRVIGLKAAEQSRRKTCPAEKAADVGNSLADRDSCSKATVNRSVDESNSSGSSVSSPRKRARRVPLVTVSVPLPMTPTVFTLRSRARLAQMQQKNETPSTPQDTVESQSCITQTGFQMKHSTQSDVDGKGKQTVTSSGWHSSDLDESDGSVPVVSRCHELAVSEPVKPQGSDKTQCNKLQTDGCNRQSLLPEKRTSDLTSRTASLISACRLEMSKPRFAATLSADENNKLSRKLSKPAPTSIINGTNSSGLKTVDVTTSSPESDRNMADGKTMTTGAGRHQRTGKLGLCDTVASGTVEHHAQNNLPSHELCSVKAGHDTISGAKVTSEQTSSKSTVTSREKSLQAVSESSVKLDHDRQKLTQKETLPCAVAENAVNRITTDVENDNRQKNAECRSDQTVEQQLDVVTAASLHETSVICSKSCASVAADRHSSQVADTNVDHNKLIRRTSARTDIRHPALDVSTSAVAEKQAWMTCKPSTPKQQVDVMFGGDSAVNTRSPLTGASMSRKGSVDLFDVAIAGTPAHCPPSTDNSSDSLLSTPFDVDVVNDGVDCAREDIAGFIVPDKSAEDLVDVSLCGKSVCLCAQPRMNEWYT